MPALPFNPPTTTHQPTNTHEQSYLQCTHTQSNTYIQMPALPIPAVPRSLACHPPPLLATNARDAHERRDIHSVKRTHAHTHTRMHTNTHPCTRTLGYVRKMYDFTQAGQGTRTHAITHATHTHTRMHTHMHTHTHTCTHTCTHTHTRMQHTAHHTRVASSIPVIERTPCTKTHHLSVHFTSAFY